MRSVDRTEEKLFLLHSLSGSNPKSPSNRSPSLVVSMFAPPWTFFINFPLGSLVFSFIQHSTNYLLNTYYRLSMVLVTKAKSYNIPIFAALKG